MCQLRFGRGPWTRSRRRARRRTGTSRTTRRRVRGGRCRRAGASAPAAPTAAAIDSATVTGRTPANARSTSAAASPTAPTARTWAAPAARAVRSRPWLRPTATSTTEANDPHGGERRTWCGRLRVVIPAHAGVVRDEADAVRQAGERGQRLAAPVERGACGQCGRARSQRVRDVVRELPEEVVSAREQVAGRGAQLVADEAVVGVAEAERHLSRRRPTEQVDHDRVVGVADGPLVGRLVVPDRRLGRDVRVHGPVSIDVVGADVEPRADERREPLAVPEPERRRLDHEHVDGGIGDRRDQRHLGVADRHGGATRRVEHRGRERGHRGLAVGSGDRDDRPVVPGGRQVELGTDGHADAPGRVDGRVHVAETGRRQDHVGRAHQHLERRGVGAADELDAEPVGRGPGVGRRRVVDDDDLVAMLEQGLGDSLVRDAEPDEQIALGHQSTPPMLRKSA